MTPSLVSSKTQCGGNPGGPVLKTLHFYWLGKFRMLRGVTKKKKKINVTKKKKMGKKKEHEEVGRDFKRLETMKSNM